MNNSKAVSLPYRQIHLDFHTSPLIPDVGVDFDAEKFAYTMKEAHVDSVTVFAMCHHGMCYYPTKVGPVHPSLSFDLMGQQIEALHKQGIAAPVYVTVVWNEDIAERHPEWSQISKDGKFVGGAWNEASWRWNSMASPLTDYVADLSKELLENYPVDGFFYDIVMITKPGSVDPYSLALMDEWGLDPEKDEDLEEASKRIVLRFMDRQNDVIKSSPQPDARVFYNGTVSFEMQAKADHMTHIEIEALPTGGWGYMYYPRYVRYMRGFGKPTMGMTGRFAKTWADFGGLKTVPQLDFECSSMLANGSVCSIGDQLHPRGVLDKAVYEVIGQTYAKVEAAEPYCRNAEAVTEIAVMVTPETPSESADGVTKALMESHYQFNTVESSADLQKYSVVIVPDGAKPTSELTSKLNAYLSSGGKLMFSHTALLDTEKGDFALEKAPVSYQKAAECVPDFFHVRPEFSEEIADFDYSSYEAGTDTRTKAGAIVLADAKLSYFNRTWRHFTSHGYSPATETAPYPAVAANDQVVYYHSPVFASYFKHGSPVFRHLIANGLKRLMPDKLIESDCPPSTEITVTAQPGRTVVHMVNYGANRRGTHVEVIEHVTPLTNRVIKLRMSKAPSKAYIAPEGIQLNVSYDNGIASVVIPQVGTHGMVVFED